MPSHQIGTREQWLAARGELLAKEKELTRRSDELAAERRNLPGCPSRSSIALTPRPGPRRWPNCLQGGHN